MRQINDWNGRQIEIAESASGVQAVVDYSDNLIRPPGCLWPPPEIVQKLYQSNHNKAYLDADRAAAIRTLGFYSDLQSIHSEDAITWSTFGPLVYGDKTARCEFLRSLLRLIDISVDDVSDCAIWLWRRIAHPDTLVSGGPEIDFGIHCKQAIILGESKWRSEVCGKQGKDKKKDQLVLRQDFLQKYASGTWGIVPHMAVLGVSWKGKLLTASDISIGHSMLHLRDTTWDALVSSCEHPNKEQLLKYLAWKKQHSKPVADVCI